MISVISPTHNSVSFLYDLLLSLEEQLFEDFELIIVDDHSDDNIEDFIGGLKFKYPIRFIKSDGVGPGSARNIGLKNSTRRYVTFVDSDDTLDASYLDFLYKNAISNDLDISEGLYKITSTTGKVISKSNVKAHLLKNSRVKGILDGSFSRIACGKLYKREMLLNNNVFYAEHIHNGEDHIFTLMCYLSAKKIGTVYKYMYNWRRREDSLTKKKIDIKTVDDFVEVNRIKFELISKYDLNGFLNSWSIRFFKELRVLTREIFERSSSKEEARALFESLYEKVKESSYYNFASDSISGYEELQKDFEDRKTFKTLSHE